MTGQDLAQAELVSGEHVRRGANSRRTADRLIELSERVSTSGRWSRNDDPGPLHS